MLEGGFCKERELRWGAVGDTAFVGIWRLNFQFVFWAFPAIPCLLSTITLLFWVSALLFPTYTCYFFPFISWAWGILLLFLTFCFIQATHHLSISVRELDVKVTSTFKVSWGRILGAVICLLISMQKQGWEVVSGGLCGIISTKPVVLKLWGETLLGGQMIPSLGSPQTVKKQMWTYNS